ncbi:MAG: toxin VapC [Thermoprotei archaeon]|nr:MAG: toxin VapC [Thermoprotei archaeon]
MSYVFDSCSLLNLTRALADGVIDVLKGNITVSLAYYEIGNALWKECNLYKRVSVEEVVKTLRFMYSMLGLMKVIHIEDVSFSINTFFIASKLNITYYDAAYLNVAKELDKVLVTDDKRLREIAEKINVKTLSSKNWI